MRHCFGSFANCCF